MYVVCLVTIRNAISTLQLIAKKQTAHIINHLWIFLFTWHYFSATTPFVHVSVEGLNGLLKQQMLCAELGLSTTWLLQHIWLLNVYTLLQQQFCVV